jgi:hypothetical protein
MPFSTDVIVRNEEVVFPDKCVVCGQNAEGECVKLRGNPVGFFGFFTWIIGRTEKLNVPAHLRCGSNLSGALLIRNVSGIVLATVVMISALVLGISKWQTVGLVVAVMAVPIFWQMMRAQPFEFTFQLGEFNLMFSDSDYAKEVALMNDGELEAENSDS